MKEPRERIRKKDQEVDAGAKGGKGKAPVKGKDDKGKKAAAPV